MTDRSEIIAKCEAFSRDYDDLPDGAFFCLAEEYGITVDDWAIYAEHCAALQEDASNE